MAQLRMVILQSLVNFYNFIRFRLPGGSIVWKALDLWLLFLVDLSRLFCGRWAAKGLAKCNRPSKPLILYEFEGCPYCRKVRETLSVLDIDFYVNPCPRESLKSAGFCLNSRHRAEVQKLGGVAKFPFLVDPNTSVKMYESSEMDTYLWQTYGAEAVAPLNYRIVHNWAPFATLSMKLSMFARPCLDMGIMRAPSHRPTQALELTGYESSPFVRRVREVLTRLEIPYLYKNLPMGAEEKRRAFRKEHKNDLSDVRVKLGLVRVPYLKDPNTEVAMFESADIVNYLVNKYQTSAVPNESWLDYGSQDHKQECKKVK